MEFNAKTVAIAVAATAVIVGAGVIIAKLVSTSEEKEAVDTAATETLNEEARTSALEASACQFKESLDGFDMATLYEADGAMDKKVRAALVWAIFHYINNADLHDRQARKMLPFLDGVEDIALRNELSRVAKRVIGHVYLSIKDRPEMEYSYEAIDLLID